MARFSNPRGITLDASGNIYVADTDNFTIRKITPDGTVTTIAGTVGVNALKLGANGTLLSPQSLTWVPGAAGTAGSLAILSGSAVVSLPL